MTKKTTAAKTVAVSVDKVLKENERLAKELEAALTQVKEQANEIAKLSNRFNEIRVDYENLNEERNDILKQGNHLAVIVDAKNREIKSYSALCDGLKRDNAVLRRRLAYAESELFKTKETLFNKIHEHEAITPNAQTALTNVLPALRFDVNGEVL